MSEDTDPRLDEAFVRDLPAGPARQPVTLVGVVHDHPASAYRVREVVRDRAPTTVALEVPPLAVPLFERYASDDAQPPVSGGEMSAAIQAAESASVVGIDGPTPRFAAGLLSRLYREDASVETARTVITGLGAAAKTAVRCRLAATLATWTGRHVRVDEPVDHEVGREDDPNVQANDEQTQVQRVRSVMDVFEPSRASRFRDDAREHHMAKRLAALRREGSVVAVVGVGHLEAVAATLDG